MQPISVKFISCKKRKNIEIDIFIMHKKIKDYNKKLLCLKTFLIENCDSFYGQVGGYS